MVLYIINSYIISIIMPALGQLSKNETICTQCQTIAEPTDRYQAIIDNFHIADQALIQNPFVSKPLYAWPKEVF